jgi:regulatory protein
MSKGRAPPPVSKAYLERAALAYLEKFASSTANLRRILRRKLERRCRLRAEDSAPFVPMVDEVVAQAVASGLVEDVRYAEGRVGTLRRRGASARLIAAKLAAKGVAREAVAAALDAGPDEEYAAQAYARRRGLGPYGSGERASSRERDLACLVRAGFSFAVARRIIDAQEPDEFS